MSKFDPLGLSFPITPASAFTFDLSDRDYQLLTLKGLDAVYSKVGGATPAGEAHLGEVGGNTVVVSVTPTVQSTPDYADGDVLGGKQTIANAARVAAGSGIVSMVSISSKIALGIALRLLFFKSDPSATTFTENSALSLNAADYDKLLGHVDIETSDQVDLGTPDLACVRNINLPFKLASGTTLYAVCLARGALNLASTSDLTFNYGILRD